MSDKDAEKANEALQGFFDDLGPDDMLKRAFLEALLEEIYGVEVDLSDVMRVEPS